MLRSKCEIEYLSEEEYTKLEDKPVQEEQTGAEEIEFVEESSIIG